MLILALTNVLLNYIPISDRGPCPIGRSDMTGAAMGKRGMIGQKEKRE